MRKAYVLSFTKSHFEGKTSTQIMFMRQSKTNKKSENGMLIGIFTKEISSQAVECTKSHGRG